ncbi:MAG TPA: hypothetical protein VHI13_17295 [Candidatus Kapabacteria bacterium]|nr:hypothetical protein [Candidatus Kapabacteria bacterium]
MILYYALGGGLGHLARARAVVHTLGLRNVAMLSASVHLTDRRVIGDAAPLHAPPELAQNRDAWRAWLGAMLRERDPEAMYIDTFPAGILGELCGFDWPRPIPLYHVARALRWERYAQVLGERAPRFAGCYVVEELDAGQMEFVQRRSDAVAPLALRYPEAVPPAGLMERIAAIAGAGRPLWLIVHSGPQEEIAELVGYARDLAAIEHAAPALLLVAPAGVAIDAREADMSEVDAPEVERVDCYPAAMLFPHAARIITGCGFNLMQQTEPYRERHRSIPFPRRYDDQFRRRRMMRDRLTSAT